MGSNKEKKIKKRINTDKLINVWALVTITAILSGVIVAIWIGIFGLKIAGTGAILFIGDLIFYWWVTLTEKIKKGDKP